MSKRKLVEGSFIKKETGVEVLSPGQPVAIDPSGEPVRCGVDRVPFLSVEGFVRHYTVDYVTIQTSGEIPIAGIQKGKDYWLSSLGTITSDTPTTTPSQKLGKGSEDGVLLIDIRIAFA